MSSTTKTIALAAVILVAAIAGVALAEDTDAASVQVTYHLGDATIPVTTAEDGTVVLYGPEDVEAFYTVPDGKAFVAWQTQEDGGTIYQFGATIAVSAATDLYPRLVDVAQEVTFIAGDATATAEISGGHVTVPEIDTAREGYTFDGWLWSGDDKVYQAEDIAALTVSAGDTFTAQYSPIYTVTWIVDGVTIATGDTTDTKQPADPVKDHYEFVGWKDADGVMLTDDYEITADTTFTAVFEPVMLSVTFVAGAETVATVAVPYGEMVVMPALPEGYSAWDFDFSTPIVESITVQAIAATPEEPSDTYTVQFVVDGKVIATYDSDAITVPNDPVKEGYAFQGWAIGDSVIADPATYQYTQDTVLTALFQAVEVVEHTVTFYVDGDTQYTVKVVDGQTVAAPEAPEGMQWDPAVDLDAPVTSDITVNAVPLKVTVTFAVDGEVVAILTQTIDYGGTVDMDLLGSYTFPDGYDSWDADLTMPVYEDMKINAKAIVIPEHTHWYDDQAKLLVVILAVIAAVVIIGYIVYLGQTDTLPASLSRLARKKDETAETVTRGGKSE